MNRLLVSAALTVFSTASAFALSPGWKSCGHMTEFDPYGYAKVYGVPKWAIERQRHDALEDWRKFVANGYKTPGAPDWAKEQYKAESSSASL